MPEHPHEHAEHAAHGVDMHDPLQKRIAIAMAIYAVLLTFNTMLTNSARTDALLKANEATDTWGYYQAKSTKEVVSRAELEVLQALPAPATAGLTNGATAPATSPAAIRDRLNADLDRYEKDKADIKDKADKLVEEQRHSEAQDVGYERACTIIELGVILATVALLLHSRGAFWGSVLLALASTGQAIFTFLR